MRQVVLGLLLCLLLAVSAQAADVVEEQSEALGLDRLEEMTEGYLDGVSPDASIDLNEWLSQILEDAGGQVGGVLKKAVRSGVLLLVIVLLCGMTESMEDSLGRRTMDVTSIAGALAITAVSASDLQSLIGLGRGLIDQLESFSKVLLPTVTAAAAAGGSPTGAAARQLATLLFSDVLLTAINRVLMPLVYAYVAACTAYAALGNEGLKQAADLVKWLVTTTLTVLLLVFMGYLSLAGAVAGTADAAAVKAASMAISSLVPVVGGILADATETVLAGAGIIRNAVGVFGALAVLAFCLVPFLTLGLHYLAYKAAAVLASTMAKGRIGGLIGSIGGAFGLVLGMAGACAVLLLISLITAVGVLTP